MEKEKLEVKVSYRGIFANDCHDPETGRFCETHGIDHDELSYEYGRKMMDHASAVNRYKIAESEAAVRIQQSEMAGDPYSYKMHVEEGKRALKNSIDFHEKYMGDLLRLKKKYNNAEDDRLDYAIEYTEAEIKRAKEGIDALDTVLNSLEAKKVASKAEEIQKGVDKVIDRSKSVDLQPHELIKQGKVSVVDRRPQPLRPHPTVGDRGGRVLDIGGDDHGKSPSRPKRRGRVLDMNLQLSHNARLEVKEKLAAMVEELHNQCHSDKDGTFCDGADGPGRIREKNPETIRKLVKEGKLPKGTKIPGKGAGAGVKSDERAAADAKEKASKASSSTMVKERAERKAATKAAAPAKKEEAPKPEKAPEPAKKEEPKKAEPEKKPEPATADPAPVLKKNGETQAKEMWDKVGDDRKAAIQRTLDKYKEKYTPEELKEELERTAKETADSGSDTTYFWVQAAKEAGAKVPDLAGMNLHEEVLKGKAKAGLASEAQIALGKMNDKQSTAIAHYTSSSFIEINGTLRGKFKRVKGVSALSDTKIKAAIETLDSIFASEAAVDTKGAVLQRGISRRTMERMKVGQEFVDDAYMSTTSDSKVAKAFATRSGGGVMKIKTKKGTMVIGGTDFESELILPRGTRLRIVRIKNGVVEAEIV